ncbi:MAG: endonuclease/exonuclease/phosphatase family protein [Myxococcales bacterium]|nr:endonuclease/exonuclease/phosphatase family protein [Myxococcales bacterium]
MGKAFRILSANLKNGGADPEAFANLVASLSVDVLALQEVSFGQAEPLTELFDHGEIYPDDNYVGRGLLSRFPVCVERIPMSWGFVLTARLESRDWNHLSGPVEITNLHVAAPHILAPRPGLALRWHQARELDAYLERADQETQPGPARLMVGDFNATPGWPWYRRMASRFTDAAAELAAKAGTSTVPTWGPWLGGPKLLRIDHGFIRGLEVEAFEVLEIAGSDHSALVIDLTYPD